MFGFLFAAYSLPEIEEKAKSLRAAAKYTVDDDATSFDVSILIVDFVIDGSLFLIEIYRINHFNCELCD